MYFDFVFSLDVGYLAVELGLHRSERSFEAARVISLHLVYKPDDTVVAVMSFTQVLVFATTTNHLGFRTVSKHVLQHGFYSLVKPAITAVVQARNLLSLAYLSVLQRLIEGVDLLAVIFIASCSYDIKIRFKSVAKLPNFNNFTTFGYWT